MLPFPESISIILTYKCNANCDYCCFESSPSETDFLNFEEIERIIEHSLKIFTPKVIVFTGGEPTLYLETLIQSIGLAKKMNIPSRLVSNCWWAGDSDKAASVVSKLVNAGLSEINFSTGSQHQKFVDFENVLFGVRAAIDLKLKPVIVIEDDYEAEKHQDRIQGEFKNDLKNIKIIRIKKVYLNSDNKKYEATESNHKAKCKNILNILTFTPDKKVFPCCGLPIRKMSGFELCKLADYLNLNGRELQNLLYNFQNSKLFVDGPFRTICEQTQTDNQTIQHQCDLCYELYKSSNFFDVDFIPSKTDEDNIIKKLALISFMKKNVW